MATPSLRGRQKRVSPRYTPAQGDNLMARTASSLAQNESPNRGDPLAEARRVVNEAAPELAERLVRIPRQLDAIRSVLGGWSDASRPQ